MNSKKYFSAMMYFLFVACAQSGVKPEPPPANAPPPPAVKAEAAPEVETPAAKPAAAKVVKDLPPKPPAEEVWKIGNGKVVGKWPKDLLIGKFKNKKLPGYTSDVCYNYGTFAVVETRSTGEAWAAEVVVRHEPTCAKDYKGKYSNLRIIEGHFAGVAGDYIVVDGDDKTEGVVDFQLFEIATGKEVYRGKRNPAEEFHLARKDGVTGVVYFTKVKAICELAAADGPACWKKIIEQNSLPKFLPMPDCKGAFEKAKVALHEPALVTARARVKDVKNPTVEFISGKATCTPEPQ
jgi:hypothetical protein